VVERQSDDVGQFAWLGKYFALLDEIRKQAQKVGLRHSAVKISMLLKVLVWQ
jgi:hypothetical protein